MPESSTGAAASASSSSAAGALTATHAVQSRTTKSGKWSKKRRQRKQVLEELRKIVPFVNEHTPLLELLQKVINYITELQESVNRSSVDAIAGKENVSPWRTSQLEYKMHIHPCTYCSSNLASSI